MPRPFLMLTARDNEVLAEDEFTNLPRIAGMVRGECIRVRMEKDPFLHMDPHDYSGVIVCGSSFNVAQEEGQKSEVQRHIEKSLTTYYTRLIDENIPTLGLCYGLGIMTQHQGGLMVHDGGEEMSAATLFLTDAGKTDVLLEGVPDMFQGFVAHHDSVAQLPAHAQWLVRGPETTPYQMIRVGERSWGTQFHPEVDQAGMEVRIRELGDRGYYPLSEAGRIRKNARESNVTHAHKILHNFVRLFRRS